MNALARLTLVSALGMLCLQGAARGQAAVLLSAPAAGSDRTGRVATAVFHPDVSAIAAGAIPAGPPELSVTAVATRESTDKPVARPDNHMLDGELAAMVASLDHCRLDVARRKRVPPSRIATGNLALRWTILGGGQVTAMDVVGGAPVDADVMDCIRRDARRWRFTPAPGGDLRLQRALVFRFPTPAATIRP